MYLCLLSILWRVENLLHGGSLHISVKIEEKIFRNLLEMQKVKRSNIKLEKKSTDQKL